MCSSDKMKLGLFCSTVSLLKLLCTRFRGPAKFIIFSARCVNPPESCATAEEPGRTVLSEIQKQEGCAGEITQGGHYYTRGHEQYRVSSTTK